MSDEVKPYLEYLDKEMTIMGVLSAFSVTAPALMLSQIAGAEEGSPLARVWSAHGPWLMAGSGSLLLSGLFFYRQRSLLAYYHGQICLALIPGLSTYSRDEWLREADSWATWLHYRWAFGFLVLGFVAFGVALGAPSGGPLEMTPWFLAMLATVTVVVSGCQSIVLTRLSYSAKPWTVVRRYLRRRFGASGTQRLPNRPYLEPKSRARRKTKTRKRSRAARG